MPPLLFSDGFEAGYGAWASTVVTGTGTSLAAVAGAARTGAQGSRAVHAFIASDQNFEAKAVASIPPTPNAKAYVLAWVRLQSVAAVGYGAVGSKALLALRAADGQPLVWLSLRSGGVRLSYMNRAGAAVSINSNVILTAGQWYRLLLMHDRGGTYPLVEGALSVDGISWTSMGSAVDAGPGSQGISKAPAFADVGISHIANYETGTYTIDYDDVELRHSLGATTSWTLMFATPLRTGATMRAAKVRSAQFMASQALLPLARAARVGAARTYAVQATAGGALSRRTTSPLLAYAQPHVTAILAGRTSYDGFGYSQRFAGPVRAAREALTAFSQAQRVRGRMYAELGIPESAVAVSADHAPWGVAIVSSEAG